MSLEQAKEFIELMKTDEASRAKVMAVKDVGGRLRIAKAKGYDFTEEEIKSVSAAFDDRYHQYVPVRHSRCDCDDCDFSMRCG